MILKLLFSLVLFFNLILDAKIVDEEEMKLKKMIAHMLIVGFDTIDVQEKHDIYKYIKEYELGGVILFDKHYNNRTVSKNIHSPLQLKKLTSSLQAISGRKLIISIDQEGGKVARMKEKYGFKPTFSASHIAAQNDDIYAKRMYTILAKELKEFGINCNFAPVVDLALEVRNKVIYQLERSYGSKSDDVIRTAAIFMEALSENGVLSVLKHFPGHGSSLDDSHKGFVDISNTWNLRELEPYTKLIKTNDVKMIMTAHVFNKQLDKEYPATLSYSVNTKLLRNKLGFNGVIISDDLQMKAISKHYSLKDSVSLAINSGVDILLFGNQLSWVDTGELIDIIYEQVKNKSIPYSRIVESNERIKKLIEEI